jgi:hypothetical protein
VRDLLLENKELILTRDGRPEAIMLPIEAESLESILRAARRALFSEAVTRIRQRTATSPISSEAIIAEISEIPQTRG